MSQTLKTDEKKRPSSDEEAPPSFSQLKKKPRKKKKRSEEEEENDQERRPIEKNPPSLCSPPSLLQVGLKNKHFCLEFGHIIWGKISGYRPWPGLTIAGELAGKIPSPPGSSWIFWFGDHKVSNLKNSKLSRLDESFSSNYKKGRPSEKFKNALDEALKICAMRAGVDVEENNAQSLHSWAENKFQGLGNDDNDPTVPAADEKYPVFVLQILEKFQSPETTESQPTKRPTLNKKPALPALPEILVEEASSKIKAKAVKIQEMCLCCDKSGKELVAQHPLFEGGLCQECKNFVMETTFALDPDNSHAFCAICCQDGQVCICSRVECGRIYCKDCIQRWVSDSAWEKILRQDPWVCFLCNPKVSAVTHGRLQPKTDWNVNIIQLFQSHQQLKEPDLSYLTNQPTASPLRVLSLFDGIGTAKVVLDQLGIVTDAYFASEVDEDALTVTRVNHGSQITEIGDVTELTESRLSELCPIDLVIGGSPSNELSLVNSARTGFSQDGTGILFFEYYRVLSIIKRLCKGRHVFWVFENIAHMTHEHKVIISRYLGRQPALWDSNFFSPQQRARYFWGNLPTIYSTPPVLVGENRRKATLPKVKQPRRTGKKDNLEGKEGNTELEKKFGFPLHYTDVQNFNFGLRQKLIEKSLSVPVVKFLLSPLSDIFRTKKQQ